MFASLKVNHLTTSPFTWSSDVKRAKFHLQTVTHSNPLTNKRSQVLACLSSTASEDGTVVSQQVVEEAPSVKEQPNDPPQQPWKPPSYVWRSFTMIIMGGQVCVLNN